MENVKDKTVEQKKKELDVEKVLMVIQDVIHKKSVSLLQLLLNYDMVEKLSHLVAVKIEKEVINNAGILTRNLELSDDQRSKLKGSVRSIVSEAKTEYSLGIKEKERSKKLLDETNSKLKEIVDYAFGTISAEINRGLLSPCKIVKVDAKKNDGNIMEAIYSNSHHLSVPCNAIMMSSDTIDVLKEALIIKDDEFDFDRGEFIGHIEEKEDEQKSSTN